VRIWIVTALLTIAIVLLGLNLIRKPALQIPASQTTASLGLTVESRSAHLRVSWSRDNPHVRAARSGTLTIADGEHPIETVILNADQIKAGTVLYVPSGNRIRFRLDIDDGQKSSDMILAILNANGQPDVAADLRAPITPRPQPLYASARRQARAFVPPTASRQPVRTAQVELPSVPALSQNADLSRLPQLNRSPATIPPPAPAPAAAPAPKEAPPPHQPQTVPVRILHEVQPSLPRELRNALIGKDTSLEVRIHVDTRGKVTGAEVISGSSSKFLRDAVTAAARAWSYAPATIDGKPVEADAVITFLFRK
jgi:TonB family protein